MANTTIEIDVAELLKKYLEEGKDGDMHLNDYMLKMVESHVEFLIRQKIQEELNLGTLVEKNYGSSYLTSYSEKLIEDELKASVDARVKQWIKENMNNFICGLVEKYLESKIVPHLNKFISSLMVVNTENVQREMQEMEQALQDQAKGAYESGCADGYEQARKSL